MKVVKIFTDVNMTKQHKGLFEIAKRNKVDLTKLNGTLILFINKARNKVKCWSPNGVLSYIKLNTGTVTTEVIQEFARAFDDNGLINFTTETAKRLNAEIVDDRAAPIRASVLRKAYSDPSIYAARGA